MSIGKKQIDMSNEFHFYRYENGIKMLRPDHTERLEKRPLGYATGYTLQDILELPFNVYFFDTSSAIRNINETCVATCGLDSVKRSIGMTARGAFSKKAAEKLIKNDRFVLEKNQITVFEENGFLENGNYFSGLSIKSPWYDEDNKITGVFGISIVSEKHEMADALNKIMPLGLLMQTIPKAPFLDHSLNRLEKTPSHLTLDSIFQMSMEELDLLLTQKRYSINLEERIVILSKMEIKTLIQLIKGFHAGEISIWLNIKQSTVESYLSNIKNKFGVYRKSELISNVLSNQLLQKIMV